MSKKIAGPALSALLALSVLLVLPGCSGVLRFLGDDPDAQKNPDPAAVEQYNRLQTGQTDENLANLPDTQNIVIKSPEEIEKETKEKEETEQREHDEEVKKLVAFDQPVTFSGPATGVEHFCLEGCDLCETTGTMTITLMTDSTMQILYHTDCMVFGMEGCQTADKCLHVITGGYNKAFGNMVFSTCSGANNVTGVGNFDETSSSGSVSCNDGSQILREFTWENLPKTT